MKNIKMSIHLPISKSFFPIFHIYVFLTVSLTTFSSINTLDCLWSLWMMKANSLYFARMLSRAAFLLFLAIALLLSVTRSVTAPCAAPYPYLYNGECFEQCPWNNTLVTYLSPTNNSCITSTLLPTQTVPLAPSQTTPLKPALQVPPPPYSLSQWTHPHLLRHHL